MSLSIKSNSFASGSQSSVNGSEDEKPRKSIVSDGYKKTIEISNRSDRKILQRSIYIDQNHNGKYDTNELASVTLFGYAGEYMVSQTLVDKNADGYCDQKMLETLYKQQSDGSYSEVSKATVGYYDESITHGFEKENYLMSNIAKDPEKKSNALSSLLELKRRTGRLQ